MDGRIGHLHCDYLIGGSHTLAGLLATRLAAVAREQTPAAYAAALDQALGNDQAVYVLREVHCDIGLLVEAHVTDAELARRWGAGMAGAVMQSIAEVSAATIRRGATSGITAPARLIRFDDQADYVAHFLADAARGTAWDVWFYAAFAAFRGGNLSELTRGVLDENRSHLPAILGNLQRLGALHTFLAELDPETKVWLWSQLRGELGASREAFRSLWAVAVQLADRLGIWDGSQTTAESLMQAYMTTGPAWPDWRDRRGLAAALLAILSFLAGRGLLHLPWTAAYAVQEQAAHEPGPWPRLGPQVEQMIFSYLWIVMLRFVDEFELWAAPPDCDALRRAYLAAHAPPALRESGDVRAAALDILSYLAGNGSLRHSTSGTGPRDFDRAWESIDAGWRESFDTWWQAHGVEVAESLVQQARDAAASQAALDWEQSVGRRGVTGWAMAREQAGSDTGIHLSREDRIAALLGPAFLNRMHGALVSLDWLDANWLEEGLAGILVEICSFPVGQVEPRMRQNRFPGTEVTASPSAAPGGNRLASAAERAQFKPDGWQSTQASAHPEERRHSARLDESSFQRPVEAEERPDLAQVAGFPSYGPTPRQRDLLEALQAILVAGLPGLDRRDLAAPVNALRLYAALLERCPVWAGDVVAVEMIENLLLVSAWIRRCRSSGEILHRLSMGDLAQVTRLLFECDAAAEVLRPGQGDATGSVMPPSRAAPGETRLGRGEGGAAGDMGEPAQGGPEESWPGTRDGNVTSAMPPPSEGEPGELRPRSGRGDIAGARGVVSAGEEDDARVWGGLVTRQSAAGLNATRAVQFVAGLGRPAVPLLQILVCPAGQYAGTAEGGVESACAGVALLFRAVLDAQLPALAARLKYPTPDHDRFQALLLALCLRWAGSPALQSGRIDEGLLALIGLETAGTLDDRAVQGPSILARLADVWAAVSAADHLRFQTAWLRTQAAHRMLTGSAVHLYRFLFADGSPALIAGQPASGCWLLGKILSPDEQPADLLSWLHVWQEATGQEPLFAATTEDFGTDVTGLHPVLLVDPGADDALALENATGRRQIETALARFEGGSPDLPQADLTVALAAIGILRLWARWLRGFSNSSVSYLLSNFIRRPGRVWTDREGVAVELEPRPLDMMLRMAGYFEPIPRVPWLGGRTVRFQTQGE